MEMKKQEALDMLLGWRKDERLITCGINVNGLRVSQMLGMVDTVEDSFIHISATKLREIHLGDQFWITVPVANVIRYEYVEGHEAPQDYLPNILQERYIGMMGLECRDGLKVAILRSEEHTSE